jgi:integrase
VGSIQHVCRRGARYHFRRRLHLREIFSRSITIPMHTADPGEARRLAARLRVRWDEMTLVLNNTERGHLTTDETIAIFRAGLKSELALALPPSAIAQGITGGRHARIMKAAFGVAAQLPSDATSIDTEVLVKLTPDFDEADRRAVVLMLRAFVPHRLAHGCAQKTLLNISAPNNTQITDEARIAWLCGQAEAHDRAGLATDARIAATGLPIIGLLNDDLVAQIRLNAVSVGPAEPAALTSAIAPVAATPDIPFMIRDESFFNEIIETTIVDIQAAGKWNEDMAQRRRVLYSFSWITGNKRLCDYGPDDAQRFAATLRKIPTEFRWGTTEKGSMSRPFEEVMAEVAKMSGTARDNRTLDRDLTTLSRFSQQLAKTAWKPRFGRDLVVDFMAFASGDKGDNPDDPDRMPWTDAHLRVLFSSTIYTGGGACSRRLKSDAKPRVWHDAAYWVPLLLAYCILSREEGCGAECEDFVFDVETPFVAIVENMTKSKDGEHPSGLKRPSRRRMVPLHPELLRLGLREYIEAVEAQGHVAAFPELYQKGFANVGGKRFYASSGRYQLAHVDGILLLPRTSGDKRADLHSLRTTGGSALEDSETKQLNVDDIMGHAREGTGPRKYSKAWFMKGGAAILAKRLDAMIDALPNVTDHLQPAPVRLLPLSERSRTGSAVGCASRKKG